MSDGPEKPLYRFAGEGEPRSGEGEGASDETGPHPGPLPQAGEGGLGARFVNIGERCNVTGSARFKKLVLAGDYDTSVEVARDQVENGAQILDVNVDEALLDSEAAPGRRSRLPLPRPGSPPCAR